MRLKNDMIIKDKGHAKNVLISLLYGLICGAITGIVIFAFKWVAHRAEVLSKKAYAWAIGSPLYIALIFVGLIVLALAVAFLHKKLPEVRGGGISRSEGVLRGTLPFKAGRTLLGTLIGSLIAFIAGLPLGCEGPAVLIGTAIGGLIAIIVGQRYSWGRYVMTGGAAAGFAVVTGAPLSGIVFALEEVHRRFTPLLVLTVAVSVISASLVNGYLCSLVGESTAMFEMPIFKAFELSHVHYLLLLGVLIAVAVALFDGAITHVSALTKKFKKYINRTVKLVLVFIITGVLALTLADSVYSGHSLIKEIVGGNKILSAVIVLFVVRFIMMLVVTDSGATGGIFVPTLAIGALVGAISAELLICLGLPREYYSVVVMISCCAFMGGTLRAPLIGTVLFLELGGQFINLLPVVLVVFVVTVLTEALNLTSSYDKVLHNMEEHAHEGYTAQTAFFEATVGESAFVIDKTVRDVMWPNTTVVVGIRHANAADDIGVERKIDFGDTLIFYSKYYDEERIIKSIKGLLGQDSQITKRHDVDAKA